MGEDEQCNSIGDQEARRAVSTPYGNRGVRRTVLTPSYRGPRGKINSVNSIGDQEARRAVSTP